MNQVLHLKFFNDFIVKSHVILMFILQSNTFYYLNGFSFFLTIIEMTNIKWLVSYNEHQSH